ncbi:hypothetical protein GCM10027290_18690 [Micromonospora sonneratiae]|uniref:SWIM-type domain-containing protein n=1 Tax=Micromonospora sonneratiae TaxID=1184706 RepID=A0ABW3Y9V6_9ACTN
MTAALPPVAPLLVAEAVDLLPNRLRKKLDAMVERAGEWPVTATSDGFTVRVDDATTVTLLVTGGTVTNSAGATCSCLLAPACLHRAAVLSLAPVDDRTGPGGTTPETPPSTDGASPLAEPTTVATVPLSDPGPVPATGSDVAPQLTSRQRDAARGLWQAGVAILTAGVAGAGAVLRSELLRATHEARANGLYRAAEAGRIVASLLQAARTGQANYRLADLTDEVRNLLALAHRLSAPQLPTQTVGDLLGRARRTYEVQGSLRLYGLCTVPVVADSGYAGTTTYLSDRDGRLWMATDIAPGGVGRAASTGSTAVPLGTTAVTHRELSRAGLVVSGATAATTGQLGGGASVRAVRAAGVRWTEEPLAQLWHEPLANQISRTFSALAKPVQERRAGANLLFLSVRVIGPTDDGVLASTSDGTVLTLTVGADHAELPYRENLRLLGDCPDLDLLLIGEPVPARRATVQALAVGIADAGAADTARLSLPERWGDHVDLGYDRLHRSQLPNGGGAAVDVPTNDLVAVPDGGSRPDTSGDPVLQLLRRHVERVVAGGRAVEALAASDGQRMRRARFDTGAELLDSLLAAARNRSRDVFGRLASHDGSRFAEAWLALAVYEAAASSALSELSWLPTALTSLAGDLDGRTLVG